MARNVEIKARLTRVEAILPRARALADGEPVELVQDDTFFACPNGRLKLRETGNGRGQLIFYQRPDGPQARESRYRIHETDAPDDLRETLAAACGIIGRVVKRRLLLFRGQTRIHLDRVQGLGDFLELEVVLAEGQTAAEGVVIAEALFSRLGLDPACRVAGAYRDMLATAASARE